MKRTTVQEKVARGAAFLDKRRPGWENEINLNDLDLGNEFYCVLGQLTGNFECGQEQLTITEDMAIALGFFAGIRNRRKRRIYYRALTIEWRKRIFERRQKAEARTIAQQKISHALNAGLITACAISLLFMIFV